MARSRLARGIAVVAGLAAFAAAAALGARILTHGPGVVFLSDEGGARWIELDAARRPMAYRVKQRMAVFRVEFRTRQPLDDARLELRALQHARVTLDGKEIHRDSPADGDWRRLRRVDLASRLSPGAHRLDIVVESSRSPAMLWARSEALGLASGAGWLASGDGERFGPVLVAAEGPRPFAVSREFPHVGAATRACLPYLLPIFLAVAWWSLRSERHGMSQPPALRLTAAHLRWALIVAWVALLLNNVAKVPVRVGMDVTLHMDYVRYLVEHRSIPLATQGGEMMQAPLAYLILAPFYAWLTSVLPELSVVKLLRILPFACGIAQVELCYRAVRAVYPDRPDRQIAGTLLGGLLPVNLVLAQAVANEPVAAVTGGAVCLLGLRLALQAEPPRRGQLVALGIAFGLALLSKVTAVLLGPPVVLVVGLRSRRWRAAATDALWLAGTAAVVAGWYYLRNWIHMGSPFLGTWNAGVGGDWWQEPGFRMTSQFLRFGEALAHPVFAAAVGFWDGFYSTLWLDGHLSGIGVRRLAPPWNYEFMLTTAWLSLLPTAALALGALRACLPGPAVAADALGAADRVRTAQWFAVACVGCYLAALLAFNLRVPFYCVAKGSYLVATTPCLAVLGAEGLGRLGSHRLARAALRGWMACWAVAVYAGYFVV